MEANLKEIIELSGIHPLKIKSVYLYGSRIYGYNRPDSDFDVILVAPFLERNKEIKGEKYNIHIVTPDAFKDELFGNYKITYLECIFAPDWAKLQEKEDYSFKIDKQKLKKEILVQSFSAWRNAKHKMIECDFNKAYKSAYHSFKILAFGIQILEHGKIINFAECNDLHKEIMDCNFVEWYEMRDTYLDKKKELENKLKKS